MCTCVCVCTCEMAHNGFVGPNNDAAVAVATFDCSQPKKPRSCAVAVVTAAVVVVVPHFRKKRIK